MCAKCKLVRQGATGSWYYHLFCLLLGLRRHLSDILSYWTPSRSSTHASLHTQAGLSVACLPILHQSPIVVRSGNPASMNVPSTIQNPTTEGVVVPPARPTVMTFSVSSMASIETRRGSCRQLCGRPSSNVVDLCRIAALSFQVASTWISVDIARSRACWARELALAK